MDFAITTNNPENQRTDCLVVPIFEKRKLSNTAECLDSITDGYISNIIRSGDIEGKLGQTLILHNVPKLSSPRLMLVGCGQNDPLSDTAFNSAIKAMVTALKETSATTTTCLITELTVKDRDKAWNIQQAVIAAQDALYCFDTYKSKKLSMQRKLKKITFTVTSNSADSADTKSAHGNIKDASSSSKNLSHHDLSRGSLKNTQSRSLKLANGKSTRANSSSTKRAIEQALRTGMAIANGMRLTKNLANTPANICTPAYLAQEAIKLSKQYKNLSCDILETKHMQKLGMGALLAVAQGSSQDPKLITLKYEGAKQHTVHSDGKRKVNNKNSAKNQAAPIVIVGKGITFDTGGNSLKSPTAMIGMKYDMSGAATVLGIMLFAAELQLPINLIGIMACAENMPGGTATRPDDIITSMAGITIEVANTDAEGRLVLCDALTYSERFKPKAVIDVATLTGACIIALGRHHAGLFSNNAALAAELTAAGNITGDKCWQLPIGEEYQCQLDSPHADVVNVGGPEAGSITGACFLARFTTNLNWAHLDVAGTATGKDKIATGRPVPLLAQYLLDQIST